MPSTIRSAPGEKSLQVPVQTLSVIAAGFVLSDDGEQVHLPTFDLSYVVEQILLDEKKAGKSALTREHVEDCVRKYRNYLALAKTYRSVPLMPCHDIDLVWHQHVLNTKQYYEDCMGYFGYMLHHNPAMPTQEVAERSGELYVKHFGREVGYENRCVVMCCCTDR